MKRFKYILLAGIITFAIGCQNEDTVMVPIEDYIVEDNEIDLAIDTTDIEEDEPADTIADNKENDSYLDDESNNSDLDYKSVYKNFVLNDFKELHGNEAKECGLFDIGLAYPILIVSDGWLNIFGINSNGEVVLIESFMDGTHSSQFWIKEQSPILVCSIVWSDHICKTYYKINNNLEIVKEYTTRDFATIDANGKSKFVDENGKDLTERKYYMGEDETEIDEGDCEDFVFLDDSFVEAHELIMDLDKFLSL